MTSKRQKARAALLEWKAKTTPEMFVEEHMDIIFAITDKSPRLEIATEAASVLSALTERFLSLWAQEKPIKPRKNVSVEPNPYSLISISTNSFIGTTIGTAIGTTDHLTDVFETLTFQEHLRPAPEEFSLKGYDEMFNSVNRNPLRLI